MKIETSKRHIRKNKLDKFFASKDKKKQKDTGKNEQDVNEADAELAKEVDVDFGITAEFTGRTLKLTKAGAMCVISPTMAFP